MSNENIFSRFWHNINKILVPRNAKVEETNSNFVVTLQNAKGETKEERENLVTFNIPKGTSFTQDDRTKVNAALDAFSAMGSITPGEWAQVQSAAELVRDVNDLSATVSANTQDISNLQTITNATTATAGYMSATDKTWLDATVTIPATISSPGYMSNTDKQTLDILKTYSQQYTMFYNIGNTEQSYPRTAKNEYIFRFNQQGFNQEIAEIDSNNEIITIRSPGIYLIFATGCIELQDSSGNNNFTMRLLIGNTSNPITVSSGVVTQRLKSIASSNQYIFHNAYYSGTTFIMKDLNDGDQLCLCGALQVKKDAVWRHNNSRLVLFKALATSEDEIPSEDDETATPESGS